MAGLDYGNARVRARRTRLLRRADYAELLGAGDVDRLTGLLADTEYGPEMERVLPLMRGVRRVDAGVSAHLAGELDEVCSFYEEPTRSRLGVVLGRWDVRNLVSLVRALSRRVGDLQPALAAMVPTSRLNRSMLGELASQRGVRPMVDLLVSWRRPSPEIALSALHAIPEFERTGETATIEAAVQRGFAREVDQVRAFAPADPLSGQLMAERISTQLLIALRLREAWQDREPLPESPWTVDPGPAVRGLVEASDVEAAIGVVGGLPPGFDRALAGWLSHRDLTRLADDLDRALVEIARDGLSADPLGIGVPVAYAWELEAEARNLRLVARAVANLIGPEEAEARMVLA